MGCDVTMHSAYSLIDINLVKEEEAVRTTTKTVKSSKRLQGIQTGVKDNNGITSSDNFKLIR